MDLDELEKNGQPFGCIADTVVHLMQHDRDFCLEGRLTKEHVLKALQEIGISPEGKFLFRESRVTSRRPSVILTAAEGEFELWRSPLTNVPNAEIEVGWAVHQDTGTNPCGGPYQGGYSVLYV